MNPYRSYRAKAGLILALCIAGFLAWIMGGAK